MAFKYFPHTGQDIDTMLRAVGMSSLDELYSDIPDELQLHRDYDLPKAMSEQELRAHFADLASLNTPFRACFAGNGVYDHYTPAVVEEITRRSEFLTGYTPYQAEVSQGTLQYIFEFQTMMARLTGMEVSNASMYDGTTATAEAMMMTVASARKRNKVLYSATLPRKVQRVLDTYAHYHGITLTRLPEDCNGVTSRESLDEQLAAGDVAGVIVAQPNRYGIVEDYTGWADAVHGAGSMLVMHCVANTLAVLRTPGEWGADVAAGDGQSLGIPVGFGGPHVGFMCTSKKHIRKLPGRIVGATTDALGRRSFVLTLQAREQHIRREKATSNICSNQSLMALFVTVYMSLMGDKGLREVNERGYSGAHYLAENLVASGNFKLCYPDSPFLNEFVVETTAPEPSLEQRCSKAVRNGILPGFILGGNRLLIAVTERQSRQDLDDLLTFLD